jgi:hypothetical protein
MAILEHNFLTLTMPADWEDASQVIALGPEDDGFRPNLVFSSEPVRRGEDSAAFAARQLPQLQDALDYYQVISEAPAAYGPNRGYLRHHAFRMEQGEVGQLQFYVVAAGRAHTFTFTHLREKFPEALKMGEYLFAQARLNLGDLKDPDQLDTLNF